jgi:transcriptional regulator with XRE-family HTH domain
VPKLDARIVIPNVGRRIGELREHRGLTKEDFAEGLDVSVQYASRIEKGANLTIESLVQVANVLHVGITDLFTLPTTPPRKRGRPSKRRTA